MELALLDTSKKLMYYNIDISEPFLVSTGKCVQSENTTIFSEYYFNKYYRCLKGLRLLGSIVPKFFPKSHCVNIREDRKYIES